MKKILCIGHTTYDTYYILKNAEVTCDVDHKNCKISFGFGAKIPVDEIYYGVGGGAANVSVGLAKLNLEAYLYSIIGSDVRGQYILDELKQSNINLKYLFKDLKPTNQAAIISYHGERTIFTYNDDREYQLITDMNDFNFDYVFVTSIGTKVEDIYKKITEYKTTRDFRIIYNPGSKELKNKIAPVREFLQNADILICNLQEAVEIVGEGELEIAELFNQLAKYRLKVIAITDGGNGAYAKINGSIIHEKSQAARVVERTGAGDAFSSGFVAGLIRTNDLNQALKWGIKNSASLVSKIGSTSGLLSLNQLM